VDQISLGYKSENRENMNHGLYAKNELLINICAPSCILFLVIKLYLKKINATANLIVTCDYDVISDTCKLV
jgi:hypothetical protein